MNGPFPLADAIERAGSVAGVRLVGNPADLDAALITPPNALPAIYLLSEERGDKSIGTTGLPMQGITTTLKFVLWVRNAGGAARVVADMGAFEGAVRRVFFGWRPSREFRPLTIRASGMDQRLGDNLIRQLLMTTSYRHTTEATP